MTHPFDQSIALSPVSAHRFSGQTCPAYANMVGPFGGTTAAVMLNAVLQHPSREGEPIALTVNFAGPVADGVFEIEALPVRTNRSTQHWVLRLEQGGAVCATGSAVFAQRRQTWSAPEAQPPQDMPPADTLPRSPLRGGAPAWVRAYDMRFAPGEAAFHLDGQEQADSRSRLWVRDEPPRPLDHASLAALCDSFFPRIFVRRRRLALIGTVSLTSYFHADSALLAAQGEQHLLATARALNFRDGYFDQSAELWGHGGALLASTHQIVYYKE